MKFLVRLVLAGILGYILLKLGLIKLIMLLFIAIGAEIIAMAKISPVATAIGILIFLLLGGVNLIRADDRQNRRR